MTTFTRVIRVVAGRFCGDATMERLVEPILADIELEYRDAVQSGRVWLPRWVLVSGYAGLCRAVALHAMHVCASGLRLDEPAKRTMAFSAGAFVVLIIALNLPPLISASSFQWPHLALYSVPQAIPLSIPIALSFGILCGWSRGTTGRAMLRRVLVLGIAGALTALATMEWVMPAASRAFSATVQSRQAEAGRPERLTITRSINDRSLSELASLMVEQRSQRPSFSASESKMGSASIRELSPRRSRLTASEQLQQLQFRFHQRLALCLSAAAVSLLAVAVASAIERRNLARAVFAALFLMYVFAWYGAETAVPALPPAIAGWLANAGAAAISVVLFVVTCARVALTSSAAGSTSR